MADTVLRIYRALSGQWSGIILQAGEDVARIAGCASSQEVEEQAYERFDIDRVEMV